MSIDNEILQEFLVEAGELHEQLNDQFSELEKNPEDDELLNAIFRAFHTIKGGAGFMRLSAMVEVCHRSEDIFNLLRTHAINIDASLMDTFYQVIDVLDDMFKSLSESNNLSPASPVLLQLLDSYLSNPQGDINQNKGIDGVAPNDGCGNILDVTNLNKQSPVNNVVGSRINMDDEFEQMCTDVIEEHNSDTRKMVIDSSVSTDNKLITDAEFDNLLDEIHGSGKHGVISKEINNSDSNLITDNEFDDMLDKLYGKNKGPGSSNNNNDKKLSNNDVLSLNTAIDEPSNIVVIKQKDESVNTTKKKTLTKESSVRVDTERLDDIMNLVGELVLVRNRLSTLKSHTNDEQITESITSLEYVTSELQSSVMKTRMQPIKKAFSKFPRVMRDLSRKLNKDIKLELIGEETDLDKSLVEALVDPLIHLVRNAADHGIESPEERYESGKVRQGTVTLSAKPEGDQVLLIVSDDGKGMDHKILRRKAVEQGLYSENSVNNLSKKEVYNLIFEPGFSTKSEISDVSGRGVGMDVVKTRISELNGTVEIDSSPGKGSVITIHLPLTLAILPTLMVMLDKRKFALPLSNVYEAFNLQTELINVVDGQKVMRIRDQTLPLFYMQPWFSNDVTVDIERNEYKVIIVQMFGKKFCLVVDQILGQEEIVIKPLGAMLEETPGFSGATITGDGSIALVIDVPSLMSTYTVNNMVH